MTRKQFDIAEMKRGEVWVGNTHSSTNLKEKYPTLKTIRLGNQAYDIKGEKIPTDYCRPVFVHKSEEQEYEAIMLEGARAARRGY